MLPGTYPFGYPQMPSENPFPPHKATHGPQNFNIPRNLPSAYRPMPPAYQHPPFMYGIGPHKFNTPRGMLPNPNAAKFSPPSAATSFRGLGATPPTPLQERQSHKQQGSWGLSMPSPGPEDAKAYCPSSDLDVEACWWPSGAQSYAADKTRAEMKKNGGGNKVNYDQGWGAPGKKSLDDDSSAITPAFDLGLLYRNIWPGDGGAKQYEVNAWGASNESKGPDAGRYREACVSPAPPSYGGRHHCDGWDVHRLRTLCQRMQV